MIVLYKILFDKDSAARKITLKTTELSQPMSKFPSDIVWFYEA